MTERERLIQEGWAVYPLDDAIKMIDEDIFKKAGLIYRGYEYGFNTGYDACVEIKNIQIEQQANQISTWKQKYVEMVDEKNKEIAELKKRNEDLERWQKGEPF